MLVSIEFTSKINKVMRLVMIGQGGELTADGEAWLVKLYKGISLDVITQTAHAQECDFVLRTVDFKKP